MRKITPFSLLAVLALASCGTVARDDSSHSSEGTLSSPDTAVSTDQTSLNSSEQSEPGTIVSSFEESTSESDKVSSSSSSEVSSESSTLPDDSPSAYRKVTSTEELTDGSYLIGAPEHGYFLNASAAKIDSVSNYVSLSVTEDLISSSDIANSCALTYDSSSRSLTLPNGNSIYAQSGSNSLLSSPSKQPLSIEINSSGYADIVSNSNHFAFNKTSGQTRFRFYKPSSYANFEPVSLYKKVVITPIYPTAVYLPSAISAEVGDHVELNPTFAPSDANVLELAYSSSNPDVVSVEGAKLTCLKAGTSTVTVSANTQNGSQVSASTTVTVTEKALSDYTVMIYMCGSDLESASDGKLATANIKEILSVDYGDSVNVILQTGGSKKWWTSGISASKLGRYHVENGKLVQDASLPKASMGSPKTFQSFLEWGLNEYPAKQTGVILWNHGGAMSGVCYDENYADDSLMNSEVRAALRGAFQSTNRTEKLSWIGYDACLMSVADIADFNSDYFDYMISSQEAEPGEGWDYDSWLGDLANNPKISISDLGKSIIDSYVAKCGKVYQEYGYPSGYNDATLALLDLSKAGEFAVAYENLGTALQGKITSKSAFSSFAKVADQALRFGMIEEDRAEYYPYDVFDLSSLLTKMKASSAYNVAQISDVETAMNDLVEYRKNGKTLASACGLSVFVPTSGYSYASDYSSSESDYSTWVNFFSQYGTFYR
ncbi:MAG: clostripain-related cysteine peptidase [Candidatus Enteromonas sp.]|nr:clostripain-related cysteine peptidase [Candidatus Enteromonas sp.]